MRVYDPGRLLHSFNQVWGFSEPSTYATSGVHDRYQTAHLMLQGILTVEGGPLEWVLNDFAPVHEARATILNPGGYIRRHIDQGKPYLDRWQVPVQVAGKFIVEDDEMEQIPGVPWQVEFWRPHELFVPVEESQPRLTILIDRAVPSPFRPKDGDYKVLS